MFIRIFVTTRKRVLGDLCGRGLMPAGLNVRARCRKLPHHDTVTVSGLYNQLHRAPGTMTWVTNGHLLHSPSSFHLKIQVLSRTFSHRLAWMPPIDVPAQAGLTKQQDIQSVTGQEILMCRGLIQQLNRETFFFSLLHPPCWFHRAAWKNGHSNCRHNIKILELARGRRKTLWFKESSRRPFIITHCLAVGHMPISEPAPGMWRKILLKPVIKEEWGADAGGGTNMESTTVPLGRGEAGLPGRK